LRKINSKGRVENIRKGMDYYPSVFEIIKINTEAKESKKTIVTVLLLPVWVHKKESMKSATLNTGLLSCTSRTARSLAKKSLTTE